MRFKLLVVVTSIEYTEIVIKAAKKAGATGATIIPGRGTGVQEAHTFFGLTLEERRDIIIGLVAEHLLDPIMDAVAKAGEFARPGTGIAFVLDVENVRGLESQTPYIR